MCRRCDTHLIPGVSANHRVENASKGGRKRCADVLVVKCEGCGSEKRFTVGAGVGAARGKKSRGIRGKEDKIGTGVGVGIGGGLDQGQVAGGGNGKAQKEEEYTLWSERAEVVDGVIVGNNEVEKAP